MSDLDAESPSKTAHDNLKAAIEEMKSIGNEPSMSTIRPCTH